MKSLAPFHGQVNKALRSISHWLVSLLVPIFIRLWISILTYKDVTFYPLLNTDNFSRISNRGKWACLSQIGALPPGQKCIVAAARERLSVCVSPGLHLVKWTRHNMDPSQIVAAFNARQSGSQVELPRISVSLGFDCFLENGCDKIRTIFFIETSLDF